MQCAWDMQNFVIGVEPVVGSGHRRPANQRFPITPLPDMSLWLSRTVPSTVTAANNHFFSLSLSSFAAVSVVNHTSGMVKMSNRAETGTRIRSNASCSITSCGVNWILAIEVVRPAGGWNWLGIISSGGT